MILETSVSVGAPYYNFAFNLLLAPLILFMAFAPQISWGKHEKKDKQLPYILVLSLVISLLTSFLLNFKSAILNSILIISFL